MPNKGKGRGKAKKLKKPCKAAPKTYKPVRMETRAMTGKLEGISNPASTGNSQNSQEDALSESSSTSRTKGGDKTPKKNGNSIPKGKKPKQAEASKQLKENMVVKQIDE